ncbi:hypothetical protein [Arthrobacter sp. NicSoilB4]|uniref:hypothetical protein n=1 Tax=Arthrobacter sp. NicSoilB4 TaxID=2830997 RepID=UPI001CC57E44|nr:hypothetical protein [Arthrobacter sp. NicSoilB4]
MVTVDDAARELVEGIVVVLLQASSFRCGELIRSLGGEGRELEVFGFDERLNESRTCSSILAVLIDILLQPPLESLQM